jgi:hypothetical protein
MNRDLLPIEVRDTHLDSAWNRGTGYALALGASPRHARLDPVAHQCAFKLGERGQHREDHLPLRGRRVDVFLNRLELTARFNIAPTQDVPVIIRNSPNRIVMMRWGLKQHLDNLSRKDSLSGAATAEISVCLGNYSASHFAGSAIGVAKAPLCNWNEPQSCYTRPNDTLTGHCWRALRYPPLPVPLPTA